MDAQTRNYLKSRIDAETRIRVERGRGDVDPENLTRRALEAEELGYDEIAQALRNFRDKVVNPLLAEGWSLERIENAAMFWLI